MIGQQNRRQQTLFIPGDIEKLIPENHILKRVNKVLDLSWFRKEVEDCYCLDNGRPGIDPETALRLMLAGFFQGIVHDRKLVIEAEVNLAIRWFAGFQLEDKIPDHSSLTKIRQKWGMERFKRIFQKTVEACIAAKLVSGDTVHIDSTLIRADVSWESLTTRHAERVFNENVEDNAPDSAASAIAPTAGCEKSEQKKKIGRPRTHEKKPKKYSTTDPDATMSTANKKNRMEPTYKQHTVSDDKAGVIIDVEVTTGEVSEGTRLVEQVDRTEKTTGIKIKNVTADKGYSHPMNFEAMEEREIKAIIPAKQQRWKSRGMPLSRFKYDALNDIVKCPAGKILTRRGRGRGGWIYSTSTAVCRSCPHHKQCVPPTAKKRAVKIADGYEALARARRLDIKGWDEEAANLYKRHKWRVEGVHGEAKTQHGLRRAVRRGMVNVAIQVYLTAVVMNLKRLAALLFVFLRLKGLFGVVKNVPNPNFRTFFVNDYYLVGKLSNSEIAA